jgi:hypothetical protein
LEITPSLPEETFSLPVYNCVWRGCVKQERKKREIIRKKKRKRGKNENLKV